MSKQIISKAVGIDLGTTNSAVGVMNPTDTEIVIHRDPVARRETTPSCVWKNPKTGDITVGHKAFRRIGASPAPVRSIKRLMGQQNTVPLTDVDVTPEQVSAYILGEMKRQIEEDVSNLSSESTQWIVDRAIITVPAYFDQPQIDATRKAGEMAGLKVINLLHEPTAAACYYCWQTGTRDGVFLVYDFGGGTFDVSVLRSTAGAFEVLGISGNNRLGGDDLDMALAEYLQEKLLREDYALELDLKNDPEDRLRFDQLKLLAEGVKKALSTSGEYLLRDTGTLKDKEGSPVIIETMFERPEIEDIMKPVVERTVPYCFDALEKAEKKAGVKLADVDVVILTGGSTHIPLVREMVRQNLCANPPSTELVVDERANQPRAKCDQPLYEKVDTLVALGAAIRAAAVGGLAVYNPEQTVRVSFRGTGSTGAKQTHIGGKVEALDSSIDLSGGLVRLIISDLNIEDQQELNEDGNFGFRKVPLQPSAENLLTFEVYDRNEKLVARAGRPVSQGKESARPTGGSSSTAVLSKAILLEVDREGKPFHKKLFKELTTLPKSETFNFSHPGDTELILLPLYQHKRKIQVIKVTVPSSLQKGTPVELDVHVDELSFITVNGKIGEVEFDAAVELPPEREMPTDQEIETLERTYGDAVAYLNAGKKNIAEARYKKAKKSFEAAAARGDKAQALHDFEEMEELVADISRSEGPIEPPKEFLDGLVKECHEINQYTAKEAAKAGKPHKHGDIQKAIEAQRVQGEKAFKAADQKAYSEVFTMLENIRNHLIALVRSVTDVKDTRTETEKTSGHLKSADGEASKVSQHAAAKGRKDFQDEAEQIKKELKQLSKEAQKNPRGVQEKVSKFRARLEQIMNVLMGKQPDQGEGKILKDLSVHKEGLS
jgi:molecular chaperone DnaK